MPGVWRAVAHSQGAVVIFHSPRACAHVARSMDIGSDSRNLATGDLEEEISVPVISSLLEEKHSIFGGIERLGECIDYVVESYKPECIVIANSCVAGVIGDDVESLAKEKEIQYQVPIITVDCYGFLDGEYYKGYYEVTKKLIDRFLIPQPKQKRTAIFIGDIGGPWLKFSQEVTRILNNLGVKVLGGFPGYINIKDMSSISRAEACLTLVARGQRQNYLLDICKTLSEKFEMKYFDGIYPIGLKGTVSWLRSVGNLYGLQDEAEKIIQEELENFKTAQEKILRTTRGKTAYITIGRYLAYFEPAYILESVKNLELDVKGIILLDVYEEKNKQEMLARLKELTDLPILTQIADEEIINKVDIVFTTHDVKNLKAKALFIPMMGKAGFSGELELMKAVRRLLVSRMTAGGLTYV